MRRLSSTVSAGAPEEVPGRGLWCGLVLLDMSIWNEGRETPAEERKLT